jgi:hypothetical protein
MDEAEDDEEVRGNARSEKHRASFGDERDEDIKEKYVSGSSKKAQSKAALGTVLLTTTWNIMCRSRNVELAALNTLSGRTTR